MSRYGITLTDAKAQLSFNGRKIEVVDWDKISTEYGWMTRILYRPVLQKEDVIVNGKHLYQLRYAMWLGTEKLSDVILGSDWR